MAKIYSRQLESELARGLAPIYLVAGDDILLQNEAVDTIRAASQKQGYTNREYSIVEKGFDWNEWFSGTSAMSLFGDRRLIELRLHGKLTPEGRETLREYIDKPGEDIVLLIVSPRLDSAQLRQKWLQLLVKTGVYLPIYPLEPKQLPAWLAARARKSGLDVSPDAIALLAERVEGNLLSAVQEIEKLALLIPAGKKVDARTIATTVADTARFSAFDLIDHAIGADPRSSCRALRHLREEGVEIPVLNGALARELRILLGLLDYESRGELDKGIRNMNIFPKRRQATVDCAHRSSRGKLEFMLGLLSRADISAKRGEVALSWNMIETVVLGLAGVQLSTAVAYRD